MHEWIFEDQWDDEIRKLVSDELATVPRDSTVSTGDYLRRYRAAYPDCPLPDDRIANLFAEVAIGVVSGVVFDHRETPGDRPMTADDAADGVANISTGRS